ncbi:MAG: DUF1987 domain-containing protein [Flavobacteriales bacterium]|nr:DUF1987 domain-containing protein [Flavobacteriales bacterium]MCB9447866.1 DUF1987 domain-containing protein [Flavobacteriales bacterium]
METLQIQGTVNSPTVLFNAQAGILEISGRSIPEAAHEFFAPLVKWLKEYATSPADTTTLNLRLEYINSNSFKMILDIFRPLEDLYKDGKNVVVKWYYEEDDEAMLEAAEDYKDVLTLPFKVIAVEEF